jgi:molybdopterin-containing oxidoreductase family iron-sulfur binding subunit
MNGEDVLLRMQRELQAALGRKTVKWGMVIDLRKCVGCHACTVSCIAENHLPPDVVYRPVAEQEIGTYPNVSWAFLPKPCMHCDNPPCIKPCPADATHKRADGIVDIDYAKCIGCQLCVDACPYDSRHFDDGSFWTSKTPGKGQMPYETLPTFEYGKQIARDDENGPQNKVRKCTFCAHRLDQGLLPQCVTTCIGRATFFGDLNDSGSLISELVKHPAVMRLKEELGTKPSVYYIAREVNP